MFFKIGFKFCNFILFLIFIFFLRKSFKNFIKINIFINFFFIFTFLFFQLSFSRIFFITSKGLKTCM